MTACCPGPDYLSVNRRAFMQVGGLAVGGLALNQLLAGRAAAGQTSKKTSVILLYMHGGPSHLETYDLKPEAPSAYRSVFNPISTNVAGMELCEHFPRQAKIADKIALVRSLHHDVGIHSDGGIVVLTGKRPRVLDPTSRSRSEHPDFGHVASRLFGLKRAALPPFVAIPKKQYMTQPNYLGAQHAPLEVGDPSAENYAPPSLKLVAGLNVEGLNNRSALLRRLDRLRGDADQSLSNNDEFRNQAMQLLTSAKTADAFDIAREDKDLRDRYGRDSWGQGCLLARRLAEAGVGVVSLYINTPKVGQEFTNWDDHISNAGRPGHFATYMKLRLEYFDRALSALIEDIYRRNLDRSIMVVAMGEFGRTPRLSSNATGTGRNHWPQAYTVLFSGGALRTGQVVGATNSKGEYPTERPYTPGDVLATVYRHLGIDPRQTFLDHTGRPIAILPQGDPIAELV